MEPMNCYVMLHITHTQKQTHSGSPIAACHRWTLKNVWSSCISTAQTFSKFTEVTAGRPVIKHRKRLNLRLIFACKNVSLPDHESEDGASPTRNRYSEWVFSTTNSTCHDSFPVQHSLLPPFLEFLPTSLLVWAGF